MKPTCRRESAGIDMAQGLAEVWIVLLQLPSTGVDTIGHDQGLQRCLPIRDLPVHERYSESVTQLVFARSACGAKCMSGGLLLY